MAGPLLCGALYWPAEVGPYLWQEPRSARVAADLRAIRASGLGFVRLPLAWDAFMPSHRQVSRARLRDLEAVLSAAVDASLQVVPVLFAQSHGDCVWLPRYAVDRRRPRAGVRVISDGNVQAGGPRDVYTDELMLELATAWLDELLRAFANHPAVLAWDLGHDPATTVRPRRVAHLAAWAELLGARVRAQQDACWLTLGAGDVLNARGVRLAAVAPHVDTLGLLALPQHLGLPGDPPEAGPLVFTAQLAQRLAMAPATQAPPALVVTTGVASGDPEVPPPAATAGETSEPRAWDTPLMEPGHAARHAAEVLERLTEAGVAGVAAAGWCDTRDRTFAAPPFDRFPSLGRLGLADPGGALKAVGVAWSEHARREHAAAAPAPWPDVLDVEEYYANLPDSALELLQRWRAEQGQSTAP